MGLIGDKQLLKLAVLTDQHPQLLCKRPLDFGEFPEALAYFVKSNLSGNLRWSAFSLLSYQATKLNFNIIIRFDTALTV